MGVITTLRSRRDHDHQLYIEVLGHIAAIELVVVAQTGPQIVDLNEGEENPL